VSKVSLIAKLPLVQTGNWIPETHKKMLRKAERTWSLTSPIVHFETYRDL